MPSTVLITLLVHLLSWMKYLHGMQEGDVTEGAKKESEYLKGLVGLLFGTHNSRHKITTIGLS